MYCHTVNVLLIDLLLNFFVLYKKTFIHIQFIFQAIIRAVIGHGIEPEDQKHTWMEDAEAVCNVNHYLKQTQVILATLII